MTDLTTTLAALPHALPALPRMRGSRCSRCAGWGRTACTTRAPRTRMFTAFGQDSAGRWCCCAR